MVCQGPGGGLGHRVWERDGLGIPFRPLEGGGDGAKTTSLWLSTPNRSARALGGMPTRTNDPSLIPISFHCTWAELGPSKAPVLPRSVG